MEAFSSTDEEQFNIIKQVIDLCDYYILVIGNRYGSVNNQTNKSYTEMEYDYAVEKNIPVLVFSINYKEESAEDKINQGKLEEFRQRAMKNRLASVCNDISDLSGRIAISIMKAVKVIKRPGWQRVEYDYNQLLETITELTQQNTILERKLGSQESLLDNKVKNGFDMKLLDSKLTLNYWEYHVIYTNNTIDRKLRIEKSLRELFQTCSIKILGNISFSIFKEAFDIIRDDGWFKLNSDNCNKLLTKFEKLGLIKIDYDKETMSLTENGKIVRDELNEI